jgi:hypothetical protein
MRNKSFNTRKEFFIILNYIKIKCVVIQNKKHVITVMNALRKKNIVLGSLVLTEANGKNRDF